MAEIIAVTALIAAGISGFGMIFFSHDYPKEDRCFTIYILCCAIALIAGIFI